MKFEIIVDLVLILIAVCIIVKSYQRGLVASLIGLLGSIVSYAVAWTLSKPCAQTIYDTLAREKLIHYVEGKIPVELQDISSLSAQIAEAKDQIVTMVNEAVAGMNLGRFLPDTTTSGADAGNRFYSEFASGGVSVAEALVNTTIEPMAISILRIVCFLIIFSLVSLVVSVCYRIGLGVNYIPLVGGLNHFFGMLLGLLQALIVVYLVCLAITFVVALTGGKLEWLNWKVLGNTKVFEYFTNLKLPATINIFSI